MSIVVWIISFIIGALLTALLTKYKAFNTRVTTRDRYYVETTKIGEDIQLVPLICTLGLNVVAVNIIISLFICFPVVMFSILGTWIAVMIVCALIIYHIVPNSTHGKKLHEFFKKEEAKEDVDNTN